GVEPKCACKTGFGADRMVRLELRDLILAPGVVAVRLRHLHSDAPCRIFAYQLAFGAPFDEVANSLQPIFRIVRQHGVEERDDEFLRQQRKRLVAVLLAEMFEDGSALTRRAAAQTAESLRFVILGN